MNKLVEHYLINVVFCGILILMLEPLNNILSFEVTGLVCSAILKKLSKKANNVKEQVLSNDLEEHSK